MGVDADPVHELISMQRYGVEYQPIIGVHNGDILGFEALARFYSADGTTLSPLTVFEHLHNDRPLLRQVEYELKMLQIDYAPGGYDLFINIDPHAIEVSDLENDPLMIKLTERPDIVVELIENSDIHEARIAIEVQKVLKGMGIRTALDDIGAAHALISLEVLSLVDYLKFDRSWTSLLQEHTYSRLFHSMLDFARHTDKRTILEGIETEGMLSLAREYGIERVQGFLYRPLFRCFKP